MSGFPAMKQVHPIIIVVTGFCAIAATMGMFGCKSNHADRRKAADAGSVDTIVCLCACFQPPALWRKYDSAALHTIINPNDKQRGSLHLEAAAGYYRGNGPFFTISALVDSADRAFPVTGLKIQDYCVFVKESLKSTGAVSILQSKTSEYSVTTLRIAAPEALVVKVVFFEEKKNKAFEADYILPAPSNSDTSIIHTVMNSALSFKALETCSR
jgi:hypothetical protein